MLPEISSAMLVVTHRCNLECRYCFVKQKDEDMDIETAREAARFLAGNARRAGTAPAINFFGGEPMLRWEGLLRPLAREIRAEGRPFRLSVTTNGTLLDGGEDGGDAPAGVWPAALDGRRAGRAGREPAPSTAGAGALSDWSASSPGRCGAGRGVTLRMTAAPWSCGGLFESIRWAEGMGFRSFFVIPDVFSPLGRRKLGRAGAGSDEIRRICALTAGSRASLHTLFPPLRGRWTTRTSCARPEGRASLAARGRAENKCGLGAGRFASIAPDGGIYACQELCSNAGPESPFYIGSLAGGRQRGEAARADCGVFQRAAARGGRLRRLPL